MLYISSPLPSKESMKKYFAELIGTFCLVIFGCGAAMMIGETIPATILAEESTIIEVFAIAAAFGLAFIILGYTIGPISGCHVNPAVTLAMFFAGNFNLSDTIFYILAQIIGAVIGAAALYLIESTVPDFIATEWILASNGWGEHYTGAYSTFAAFVIEAAMTFILAFIIFMVNARYGNRVSAGIVIGLTVMLIHLVSLPITGTSVNPARSLGPAIFAGGKALQQVWLFIIAPVVGGIAAALFWRKFFYKRKLVV